MNAGVLRRCRRGARLATTHGSATWPDALRLVHRHNEGARELPIGWRSSTIAVALRPRSSSAGAGAGGLGYRHRRISQATREAPARERSLSPSEWASQTSFARRAFGTSCDRLRARCLALAGSRRSGSKAPRWPGRPAFVPYLCSAPASSAGSSWSWARGGGGRGGVCAFDGMGAVRADAQPYLGPRPCRAAGRRHDG